MKANVTTQQTGLTELELVTKRRDDRKKLEEQSLEKISTHP